MPDRKPSATTLHRLHPSFCNRRCLAGPVASIWAAASLLFSGGVGATDSATISGTLQLAVTRGLAEDVDLSYHIDADGRGANPRHGFTLAFTPDGVQVDGQDGGLALELERFGRGDGAPVRQVAPRIEGAWIEYERAVGLQEWFVNLPQGLEQGWTVLARPSGDGPLVLNLDTGRPPDRTRSESLAWSGLVYQGLIAIDATGQRLPSQWTHRGDSLHIEVDDDAAIYPVVIDPWIRGAKLGASDAAHGDAFGVWVAASEDGSTVLVGATGNGGSAYVFDRDKDGALTEQAKLVASDGGGGNFGRGVDLSADGNTALVGGHRANGPNGEQGAAYVFIRAPDGSWNEEAKLTASDGATDDAFGELSILSGDGNTALIGAVGAAVEGNGSQGAAYIFTQSGGGWTEQAKLTASDGEAGSRFGSAGALSGDTALVGALGANIDGNVEQGAAYVFTRSGDVWTEQTKLTASDGAAEDHFGAIGAALSDDTALVGAWAADDLQGAVYVFTRSGDTWIEQTKLAAFGEGPPRFAFGVSIALSGDTALIGAYVPLVVIGAALPAGAAYTFKRADGEWSEHARLLPPPAEDDENNGFGLSLSLDGSADTALVGAFGTAEGLTETGGPFVPGAAYEFVALPSNFAVIEGTVLSLRSACETGPYSTTAPLLDASVQITGAGETHTASTDANGYYQVPVDAAESPVVDIEITAPGHLPVTVENVELDGEEILVKDFDLEVDFPCIATDPGSFAIELEQGEATIQPLTIANTGNDTLEWSIAEQVESRGRILRPITDQPPTAQSPRPTYTRGDLPGRVAETQDLVGGSGLFGLGAPGQQAPPDPAQTLGETFKFSSMVEDAATPDAETVVTHPLSVAGGPAIITHSESLVDILRPNTVACTFDELFTVENQFLRTFTLPDFGIAGTFDVTEVTFGIQDLTTPASISVNLYILEGEFVFDNMTLIGSSTEELEPQFQSLVTVPVNGTVPAGATLVVEIAAPDLADVGNFFFPGSNGEGETAPSYLAAEDCGTPEPTPFADIGFPDVHLVMAVSGTLDCSLPDWTSVVPLSGSVPAGGSQGAEVSFDSTSVNPGLHQASLCISTNDPEHPLAPVLLGLTVTSNGVALTFDPSSLDFGDVGIGSTSLPQTTALENIGIADATGLTFTPAENGFDVDASDCGDTLPAGQSCQIIVTFTPGEVGDLGATLHVNSAEGAPASVSLTGTGIEIPPEIDVDPEALSATLDEGQTETQSMTVANRGEETLEWTVTEDSGSASPITRATGPATNPLTLSAPTRVEGLVHSAGASSTEIEASHSLLTMLDEIVITHSESLNVQSQNTVACANEDDGTTPINQFLRTFTLEDFDITADLDITEVTFGIETLSTNASITVNLYTLEGEFTFDNLTPIGGATEELTPQDLTLVTVPVTATAPPGSTLVVEIAGPDLSGLGAFFPGSNSLGQTAPSYIATSSCDLPEPTSFAEIGFPGVHLAMAVAGNTETEPLDCTLPDWVGVDPLGGSVSGGSDQVVDVTFDATDTGLGEHEANLCLGSNDPDLPLTVVPLALTVTQTEIEGFTPMALAVDTEKRISDGNGVFEPGELAVVVPAWHNDGTFTQFLEGTASDLAGPEGPSYDVVNPDADYGEIEPGEITSCQATELCYEMDISIGPERPAPHWDAVFNETLSDTEATVHPWTLHLGDSFADVPRANTFYFAIETLLHSGVTDGCTSSEYCPGDANSRAQMPVFMLRALMGPDYTPPACIENDEPFGDVPFDSAFCPWIQELASQGIVSGCGDGDYCASDAVSRAQMSIFLLKTLEGADYEPPGCTEQFTDVPCPSLFADWIEDLAARGITGGCTETKYCPADPVTRAQMAVFITKAFGFQLYGP